MGCACQINRGGVWLCRQVGVLIVTLPLGVFFLPISVLNSFFCSPPAGYRTSKRRIWWSHIQYCLEWCHDIILWRVCMLWGFPPPNLEFSWGFRTLNCSRIPISLNAEWVCMFCRVIFGALKQKHLTILPLPITEFTLIPGCDSELMWTNRIWERDLIYLPAKCKSVMFKGLYKLLRIKV